MNTKNKLAATQVKVRVPKTGTESKQLTLSAAKSFREALKGFGFISNDPRFSFEVSKHVLGADSLEFQALINTQGLNGENWVEFAPGCSTDQLERFRRGEPVDSKTFDAACKAFSFITGKKAPTPANDPEPYFSELAKATRQHVLTVRENLERGVAINELNCPPEFEYAPGVPVRDKEIKSIEFVGLSSTDIKIYAIYRASQIQIGLILFSSNKASVLFNPQPYVWTGSEVVVGRKRVRYIKVKRERVQKAVNVQIASRLAKPAIAS